MLGKLAQWWLGKSSASNPASWFSEWATGGNKSAAGVTISQSSALQEVITMACVSIRSQDLAKLPLHVYRRRADGGAEIVKNHPVERVLRKPNRWQTRFEFMEQMHAAFLLKGNAYAVITRDARGRPIELLPVNPDRVCLYEAEDGSLFYRVTRSTAFERASLSQFGDLISAGDVLHLRWISQNSVLGLSRISLARDAIGLSLALEEFSSALFASGARPGGILATDKKLSDEAFARIKSQWQDRYSGAGNSGKTALLEEGLKWQPLSMTAVESQTVEARRIQIEQIATAFDVPLHRLGISDAGGEATLTAHQMYLNNVLSSDAERWENKLDDVFGIEDEGLFIEFSLDYFNRADKQTRFNALRTGIVGGFLTINEARASEDLTKVEGGDVILQPTNVAPFPFTPPGSGGAGPGSDTTGAPAAGGDGDPAAVAPAEGDAED
jgi:HK97 family phage portal protein